MSEPRDDGAAREEDELDEQLGPALAAAGKERAEILQEIRDRPAPGEDATIEKFRRQVGPATGSAGGSTGRPAARARWLRLLPLAAAAALVATWWIFFHAPTRAPDDGPLGPSNEVTLVAPVGTVGEWSAFRWKPLEGATTYRVFVFQAAEASGERREIEQSSQISTLEYRARAPLPARLRWRVQAFDSSGAFLGQGEAEAELAGAPPR